MITEWFGKILVGKKQGVSKKITQEYEVDRRKTQDIKIFFEFNGFDTEHEKWKDQYVLKLGRIISTDEFEIKKLTYKSPNFPRKAHTQVTHPL